MPAQDRTVRVFISSTFRDMHAERDHLVTVVFPELRERLERIGLDFYDVDLRWGVPQTGVDGERANSWAYCKQWIDRVEPFFVCILGQRYGWAPPAEEIHDPEDRAVYRGLSITEMEIRHAVLTGRLRRRSVFYFRGTEVPQDVHPLVYDEFVDRASAERLTALKAEIAARSGRPVREYNPRWTGAGFTDLDVFGQMVLEDLWSGVLRDERYVSKEAWRKALGRDPDADPLYTDESQPIPREVWERIVEHAKPAPRDPLDAEAEAMAAFAASRLRGFQGRQRELDELAHFVADLPPDASRLCVVRAVPGQGKSALLARFLDQFLQSAIGNRQSAIVVSHFVGATEHSADPRLLVDRLIKELDRNGIPRPAGEEDKEDLDSLARRLAARLENYAGEPRIILVIDAVNQLTSGHDLFWLPQSLGPNVRIILSCVDDSVDRDRRSAAILAADGVRSAGFSPSSFQLRPEGRTPNEERPEGRTPNEERPEGRTPNESPEARVLAALANRRPEPRWVDLRPLDEADVRQIVVSYLREYCKELDRGPIDTICRMQQARNPLYLLVMLNELRTLGGNDMNRIVPQLIAEMQQRHPDAVSLFDWVLERLEVFGREPVRLWCSYLASGRAGMASRELSDLLVRRLGPDSAPTSCGAGVPPASRQDARSTGGAGVPPASRQDACSTGGAGVPPASRQDACSTLLIERGLRRYLQRRGPQLDFFHSQLRQAVAQRYLPQESDRIEAHADIAAYFETRWREPHLHALADLPYHQTRAARWDELEATLTDICFLEGKATGGMVFDLALDFSAAVAAVPRDRPQHRILRLLDEALRRDIYFIARHARDYQQALFQCLWNLGWWYDCEEAGDHYVVPEGGWPPGEPPWEQSGPKLSMLIDRWRSEKEGIAARFPWVRSLRPPPTHLGFAQRAVFRGHEDGVTSVAFSPDGRRIASGSKDRTVRVWEAESGAELRVLRGHEHFVNSVAFSPDGQRLASGSLDDTVRVWDAETGAELRVLRGHESHVRSVAFSADGRRIASSGGGWQDNTVRVWDAESGAELRILRGHRNTVTGVAFSPDGRRIASGSGDKTVRVWDAESGAELRVLRGHEGGVESVAFSPDGRRLASSCGAWDDSTVRVWDAESGAELRVLRGHKKGVYSVSFSPDGRRIASGSHDSTVRVWDAASGAELRVLRGHEDLVTSVAFSPDGRRLASGSQDRTVRAWDAESGAELRVLGGHEGQVWSVAFSPDGRRLASGSGLEGLEGEDNTLRVWDAESGAELRVFRGHWHPVNSVAFSPDGRRLASGSGSTEGRLGRKDYTLRVWEAESGAELRVLRGHERFVTSVSFSPDGRRLASGSWDYTVRVWDAESGAELRVLRGHEYPVASVAFSPDGRRLASGSDDGTVRVWDAASGECLAAHRGSGDVSAIAAGPPSFAWRALSRTLETVIEDATTGEAVAWFPAALLPITTHPGGRAWASAVGNHLQLLKLEGAESRESGAPMRRGFLPRIVAALKQLWRRLGDRRRAAILPVARLAPHP